MNNEAIKDNLKLENLLLDNKINRYTELITDSKFHGINMDLIKHYIVRMNDRKIENQRMLAVLEE